VSIVERTISIIRQLHQVCGTPPNPELPTWGGVPGISRPASGFRQEWFSLSIPITVETTSPDPKLINPVVWSCVQEENCRTRLGFCYRTNQIINKQTSRITNEQTISISNQVNKSISEIPMIGVKVHYS
jgi:hypothetical protein